ncbi:MAG: hypothetical protein PHC95_00570 [Parabacteroides sp.]|nr:hypothetical protein [Parabacteroides sp.]
MICIPAADTLHPGGYKPVSARVRPCSRPDTRTRLPGYGSAAGQAQRRSRAIAAARPGNYPAEAAYVQARIRPADREG